MTSIQAVITISLLYISVLFLIAYWGDNSQGRHKNYKTTSLVYGLSLAVYCSSWTFYGAVGTAAVNGIDYLAIYLGPSLVFLFGYPVIKQIILICKQNNITSVSDFISSRFGKSRPIAVLVTFIAVVGSLPYIALQLKAIAMSFSVITASSSHSGGVIHHHIGDNTALYVGVILAIFTILFGTRHLDATEHHEGLILAISFESIIKLVAILAVGYYAGYLVLQGDFQHLAQGSIADVFASTGSTWQSFTTKMVLSMGAIFLLPRQFHVMIVEARNHTQFRTAMWVMPVYLLLTSIIAIPIVIAGALLLPGTQEDLYVLNLPLMHGNNLLAMVAFIGGLSAATGMVIVAAISLSTMLCNDIVMPYLISLKRLDILNRDNLNNIILLVRRLAIVVLIALAYVYYLFIDTNARLANIGLVSFAATIQFLPAVISALYWKRANSKGVLYGLIFGFLVWSYTLLMPTLLSEATMQQFFARSAWLHPQALLGFELSNPLTHGVVWSLLVNVGMLVYFSLRSEQSVLEKIQASRFFNASVIADKGDEARSAEQLPVHPDTVRVLAERVIGIKNTDSLFEQYERKYDLQLNQGTQVDATLLSLVQKAIAGVIGSSSAQKIVTETLLGDDETYLEEVTTLVDETSSVLKFNRNLLQTTLQNITHGIAVVDKDLNLVVWNDRYLSLFDYPDNFIYVGKPIKEVLDFNARRGEFGETNSNQEVKKRLRYLLKGSSYQHISHRANGRVVKLIGEPMPGGGFVTTYEDITDSVRASEMLKKANEELEDRVKERTQELEVLTQELELNTRSKTHFLAAASHDLLQPINAARLFAHSISERGHDPKEIARLSKNIDQSLVTANQLLRALLDISKLDAGGIQPENSVFKLQDLFDELQVEFQEMARDKDIRLRFATTSAAVMSDRSLLLSVIQNFIANAVRYSNNGGMVLVGVRRRINDEFEIQVHDTGVGIHKEELERIFDEFYRVRHDSVDAPKGLGLGLSIASRIADLLSAKLHVISSPNRGSMFSITVPSGDETSIAETAAPHIPGDQRGQDLQGVRVLCLDNEASVLTAMQTLLQGWGCVVASCSDYDTAHRRLDEQHWDILIADYRLDGARTGLDLLSEMTHKSADCAGVLITAEQSPAIKEQTLALDCYYLDKPVEPLMLKSLLTFIINS